jgi:hypothetical protein
MHSVEKQILATLKDLTSKTDEIIEVLTQSDNIEDGNIDHIVKAQNLLESRSSMLDQFEEQTQLLRNIPEDEQDTLTDGSNIQEKYQSLMKRDAVMQNAIDTYKIKLEKQVRTNKKELGVSDKYQDQENANVGNSLFITSKLEG